MPPFIIRERRACGILVIVFAVSRLLYYLAGVRFDIRPLDSYFQIIEPDLLRHRLLESLYYFHVQPPGFNLWIGVILKLFPNAYAGALHCTYLACGLSIALLLYRLMRVSGIIPAIALAFTIAFIVSPGVVLFENYLLYEYPVALLLCAAAFAFYEFFERRQDRYGIAFLVCVLGLLMVRNQFHLVYFAAALAAAWYFAANRRRFLAVGGLLFLIAFGLFAKNWILFGRFESSTWLGMNINAITLHHLTDRECRTMIERGILTPVVLIPPMASLEAYKPFIHMPAKTGIPILDRELKAGGASNFNHLAYLQVQQLLLKDGLAVLKHFPKAYLRSIAIAWFTYFLPPGDFPFFEDNRARIWPLERFYDICIFGQLHDTGNRKELRAMSSAGATLSLLLYTGVFLLLGIPFLCAFGVWLLVRGFRTQSLTRAQLALLSFILFNILYLTLVSNFLGCFENNRYRFPLDAFYVLLAATAVNRWWMAYARSRTPGIPACCAAKSVATHNPKTIAILPE